MQFLKKISSPKLLSKVMNSSTRKNVDRDNKNINKPNNKTSCPIGVSTGNRNGDISSSSTTTTATTPTPENNNSDSILFYLPTENSTDETISSDNNLSPEDSIWCRNSTEHCQINEDLFHTGTPMSGTEELTDTVQPLPDEGAGFRRRLISQSSEIDRVSSESLLEKLSLVS